MSKKRPLNYPLTAIVIAIGWPSDTSGYGLALRSALTEYLYYFTRVHLLAITEAPFPSPYAWQDKGLTWTHIQASRQPKWQRFLRSLTSHIPAIAIQFTSPSIRSQVAKVVESYLPKNQIVVLFEDIPPAVLMPWLQERFEQVRYVIHSYNVVAKAFEDFATREPLPIRTAWKIEISKIVRLEKKLLQSTDNLWSISSADSKEYEKRYGIRPNDVLGISVDGEKYVDVATGSIDDVLYLGSADLRKGRGISRFIQGSWPTISQHYPSARFLLAGSNTERFTLPAMKIFGSGFCHDDSSFLGRGQIFVNPQEDGSGVKLKSIIAMLAGKALVSTEVGVEGVDGIPGRHFLVAPTARELAAPILQLMANPDRAMEIGQEAQHLAQQVYSPEAHRLTARSIFSNLADCIL